MSFAKHWLFGAAAAVICSCWATGFAAGAPAPQPGSTAADAEEVVVTGSRVIRNGEDMPTPVTVISAQQLQQTKPGPVVVALEQLPVFGTSRNLGTNPGNSSQNNAAQVLNLRNFGQTRDLVMFDGRRVPPTSPVAEVDSAFVPSMLLQRVDIVTGGASAVYGSDAVTGVVNFITDRNFNGLKLDANYGISSRGDGDQGRFGIAGGTQLFGGRGHFEGSFEYFNTPGIDSVLGRRWGANAWTVQGAGTAANPYRLVDNTRLSSTSFDGLISGVGTANPGNPLRDRVFSSNGVLTPFQHGAPTATQGIESGGEGGWYNSASLEAQDVSNLGFARFDFDVTDDTHLHAEVTGQSTHNHDYVLRNEFRNISLSPTNAFLDPAYQQTMASAGVKTFTFSKMFLDAPTQDSESFTHGFMADITLEGKIGAYHWEAFYHPSYTSQRTRNNANINNEKASAALDAVVGPGGQVVCNVTLTNPGLYPGCVPLNLFGPTSESPAALDYILDRTQFTDVYTMHDAGGTISGAPFNDWAGPVDLALTAEWRRLGYHLDSNAQPVASDCTGLRYNCTASTLLYSGSVLATRSPVSQTVSEGALETNVPLLKDVPFFQSLNLNGAMRLAHYDTTGNATTWKLGLEWHVNDQLSFRSTRSRDIRAPNLNELYAPLFYNVGGSVVDSHTGLSVRVPQITASNPDLKPEVAKVWTAGMVLRPAWVPRFGLSLDLYRITINNAIVGVSGNSATIQNLCEASNGASQYCALIIRPLPFEDHSAANAATAYYTVPENALQQETYGADLELNYQMPLFGGNLVLRELTGYQPHLTTQLPGSPETDAAGAAVGACCQIFGVPKVQASAFVSYTYKNVSVDVQQRWLSGRVWNADRTLVYAEPNVPSIAYTNLTLSYQWNQAQVYFTTENLFDKQPSLWARPSFSALPGLNGGYINGEDTIGRYFTAGVRMRL